MEVPRSPDSLIVSWMMAVTAGDNSKVMLNSSFSLSPTAASRRAGQNPPLATYSCFLILECSGGGCEQPQITAMHKTLPEWGTSRFCHVQYFVNLEI